MRGTWVAVGGALLVLVAGGAARTATFLDFTIGPDRQVEARRRQASLTNGSFTVSRYGPGGRFLQLYFTPGLGNLEGPTYLRLGPAAGQTLVPGVYQNATAYETDAPLINADRLCGTAPGSFVVNEVTFDPGGALRSLSVDFRHECYDGTRMRGSLRYRVGDDACGGKQGAPCDDGDPCTGDDVCHAGACIGTDAVTPTCAAMGSCSYGGICDHATGACRSLDRRNGDTCDDGDRCWSGTVCDMGYCQDGRPVTCDDRSVCTVDRCDAAGGCMHDPLPGRCLVAYAEVTAIARGSVADSRLECRLHCAVHTERTLVLLEDGTYRILGRTDSTCPAGRPIVFPDETGAVRGLGRDRLRLRPFRNPVLRAATQECAGSRTRPRVPNMMLSANPAGYAIVGRTVQRSRLSSQGIPLRVVVKSLYRFRDGVSFGLPTYPLGLPECAPNLIASCTSR